MPESDARGVLLMLSISGCVRADRHASIGYIATCVIDSASEPLLHNEVECFL